MANRVTPSGNQVPYTSAPVAFANGISGGWIGHAAKTATQSPITTEVTLTSMTQAVTVNPGRRLLIMFTGSVQMTAADGAAVYRIKEDGNAVGDPYAVPAPQVAGGSSECGVTIFRVTAPSAGVHTYTVTLARSAGSGSLAETSTSATLLILDIGPAS